MTDNLPLTGIRTPLTRENLIRRLAGLPVIKECMHLRAVRGDRYCEECGGRLRWV